MSSAPSVRHAAEHARSLYANPMLPTSSDLVRVGSRRWFLQTGAAGVAGLSMADMLRLQGQAAPLSAQRDKKSVILFWLSGGPSHLDMWDPKPAAPREIRGPYDTIATKLPGVRFCEHLPLQAKIADKLSIIRSVDCSASNHTPITMQAGNSLARRTDDGKDGGGYPSMGSIAAKFRGANVPEMPGFVGLANSWIADVWGAGEMGRDFDPVKGLEVRDKLAMPPGLSLPRLQDRHALRTQLDSLAKSWQRRGAMADLDRNQQIAYDMVLSGKVRDAFDISRESDLMRDAYGRGSIGEKGLLARRLVEAGVSYVLVSGAWGYFDHHGDEVQWGGIQRGLTPLLPTIDRVLSTLVLDLEDRGLLDSTLILMMGEFGRSPVMTATAGRGHWTNVMSMVVAGGGLPHGQVIGSTDAKGYGVKTGRVIPEDLAATVFRHLGIPLNAHWVNTQGRPIPIVANGGRPIAELS
ncbi:MAG TPA: DUF1501 domain-containing protein [Pirellulales bacterium]|jgi:hypothetical protein|nr:DUF1501 domain-containing protein [Pirellulales bacterium]